MDEAEVAEEEEDSLVTLRVRALPVEDICALSKATERSLSRFPAEVSPTTDGAVFGGMRGGGRMSHDGGFDSWVAGGTEGRAKVVMKGSRAGFGSPERTSYLSR